MINAKELKAKRDTAIATFFVALEQKILDANSKGLLTVSIERPAYISSQDFGGRIVTTLKEKGYGVRRNQGSDMRESWDILNITWE